MSRKPDLLDAAERHAKALLLKSKDVTLDEQIDALRVVTFFIATKNKVRPDKEDDDWLSDAQRKLRRDTSGSDADTPKPNGAKTERRTSRDAYLAASKGADAANGSIHSAVALVAIHDDATRPPEPDDDFKSDREVDDED